MRNGTIRTFCVQMPLIVYIACLAVRGTVAQEVEYVIVGGSYSGYAANASVGDQFDELHPDTETQVIGLSNRRGFELLAEDRMDVLMYSRQAGTSFVALARKAFGAENEPPRRHLFGQFVVLVVVHPSSPVRALNYEHLFKIYTGKEPRWDAKQGRGRAIVPVGEKPGRKGEEIFRNEVMQGKRFVSGMQTFDNAAQIAAFVADHPGAIGFCLDRQEELKGVRAISVARSADEPYVPPRAVEILAQEYPLTEDLLLFTRPDGPPLAEAYCRFACGPEGAKIAREHFLYPGLDRVAHEAKGRLTQLKRGEATPLPCSGTAAGKPLMQDLAMLYLHHREAVALDYRTPKDTATQASFTSDCGLILSHKATPPAAPHEALTLGRRAVGVIVHPDIQIDNLLVSDLKRIYEGEVTEWDDGAEAMKMYGPDSAGVAVEVFAQTIAAGRRRIPYVSQRTIEETIKTVAGDPAAIGLVDLSEFANLKLPADDAPTADIPVKLVPIVTLEQFKKSGSRPLDPQAIPKDYPLSRIYTLYVSPEASETTKQFVQFLTPARVKETLGKHGLVE